MTGSGAQNGKDKEKDRLIKLERERERERERKLFAFVSKLLLVWPSCDKSVPLSVVLPSWETVGCRFSGANYRLFNGGTALRLGAE